MKRTLVGLISLEGVALHALDRLGELPSMRVDWSDVPGWLTVTPTEDALAAVVRLIAIVCAYWLAFSTLLYVLASLSRLPPVIGSVRWVALPAVRRLVDRALAVTLAASSLTAVAPVAVAAEAQVVDTGGTLLPLGVTVLSEAPSSVATHSPPVDPSVMSPPPGLSGFVTRDEPAPPAQVTVEAGDDLWAISLRQLERVWGRRPANGEIVRYWSRVVARNTPHLRSGDPDLIYPGEIVELPSVP